MKRKMGESDVEIFNNLDTHSHKQEDFETFFVSGQCANTVEAFAVSLSLSAIPRSSDDVPPPQLLVY